MEVERMLFVGLRLPWRVCLYQRNEGDIWFMPLLFRFLSLVSFSNIKVNSKIDLYENEKKQYVMLKL